MMLTKIICEGDNDDVDDDNDDDDADINDDDGVI
jgi:hypothetical protein